jgi:hypothetical protein
MRLYTVELLDADGYWEATPTGYTSKETAINKAMTIKEKEEMVRVVVQEVIYEFADGEEWFA